MVGIYKITSPSGKVYIGQSYCISKRIRSHLSNASRKNFLHYPIYESINKYGLDAHKVEIVHNLPSDVEHSVINNYEQLYILLYKDSGVVLLNLTEGGNSGKRSQETRDRMSKSGMGKIISQEQRKKISKRLTGIIQPREVVEKRGATLRGLKRKVTDEHKLILSTLLKGNERNNVPIVLVNIFTEEKHSFLTLKKASKYLNISYNTFRRYYNGKREGYPNLDKVYGSHTVCGFKILKDTKLAAVHPIKKTHTILD